MPDEITNATKPNGPGAPASANVHCLSQEAPLTGEARNAGDTPQRPAKGRKRKDGSIYYPGAPGKKRKYARRKDKSYMTNRTPETKLQELFTLYCQVPNLSWVAKKGCMHVGTLSKYAKEQKWSERRKMVLEEARKAADYDITKATADSIRMIRTMKEKVEEKIATLDPRTLVTASITQDLERLVKLEQVLLGSVSDRGEQVLTTHEERVAKLREDRARAARDITPMPMPALFLPGKEDAEVSGEIAVEQTANE